jgi:hypothetical protein
MVRIDLVGKVYKNLTVLGYAETEKGRGRWRCACTCGKEILVLGTNLKSGNTKSCGCTIAKDLKNGDVFGRLTVVCRRENIGFSRAYQCLCECGATAIVRSDFLRKGITRSCGCLAREQAAAACKSRSTKHGLCSRASPHSLFQTWAGMHDRCSNPNSKRYKDYGGRGIRVCQRWGEFDLFVADIGPKPSPSHSIDRIDNDGPYSPENCRWATRKEQARNTRRNVMITHDGETLCLQDWSARIGVDHRRLQWRYAKGWSHAEILFGKH